LRLFCPELLLLLLLALALLLLLLLLALALLLLLALIAEVFCFFAAGPADECDMLAAVDWVLSKKPPPCRTT